MKTSQDPRHLRREKIMQELFAWNARTELSYPKEGEFDEKTEEIIKNIEQIDKLIIESAAEWGIEKINKVDLAVLRQAVYELVFECSEPSKVIIDESVELAKEFGGENSPAFVNGALGKILNSRSRILAIINSRLGADSADLDTGDIEVADLLAMLEKEYQVTIPSSIKTVNELVDFIEESCE